MLAVVMVVEGVLRVTENEGHFDTGWGLYQSLVKNTSLYLLSHIWTEQDSSRWLAKRHLTGHINYLHQPASGPAGRLDVLERMRSWRVGLVLESDPACAAAELAAGWHTALITHAAYTAPEWRPDYPGRLRPWDDLTAQIRHQEELRRNDPRTEPHPFEEPL